MFTNARRAICLTMPCIPELGCSLLRELIQHLLPGIACCAMLEPGRRAPSSTQDRSLQGYAWKTSWLSFGQPPVWPVLVLQELSQDSLYLTQVMRPLPATPQQGGLQRCRRSRRYAGAGRRSPQQRETPAPAHMQSRPLSWQGAPRWPACMRTSATPAHLLPAMLPDCQHRCKLSTAVQL